MSDPLDKVSKGLAAAEQGMSLLERLAALVKPSPAMRAVRLKARAARLRARAEKAPAGRAVKLGARATRLEAVAATLVD